MKAIILFLLTISFNTKSKVTLNEFIKKQTATLKYFGIFMTGNKRFSCLMCFVIYVVYMYWIYTTVQSAKLLTKRKLKPSRWHCLLLFYKLIRQGNIPLTPKSICSYNNINPTSIFKKDFLQEAQSFCPLLDLHWVTLSQFIK